MTKPLDVHARDFLLAGGLLAAHADKGDIAEDQWAMLLEWLLPLCADPEAEVAKIVSFDQARDLLTTSAAWLRDNAGEERFALFRQLAHRVAIDGHLSSGEQQFATQLRLEQLVVARALDGAGPRSLRSPRNSPRGRRRGLRPAPCGTPGRCRK